MNSQTSETQLDALRAERDLFQARAIAFEDERDLWQARAASMRSERDAWQSRVWSLDIARQQAQAALAATRERGQALRSAAYMVAEVLRRITAILPTRPHRPAVRIDSRSWGNLADAIDDLHAAWAAAAEAQASEGDHP